MIIDRTFPVAGSSGWGVEKSFSKGIDYAEEVYQFELKQIIDSLRKAVDSDDIEQVKEVLFDLEELV